jgi:hypothetical protein
MAKKVVIFKSDDELIGVIRGFQGFQQTTIETMTEPSGMTVKSRATKQPIAELFPGKIRKISIRHISEGYNYSDSVKNRIKENGGDPSAFTAEATYSEPLRYTENGEEKTSKMVHVGNTPNTDHL